MGSTVGRTDCCKDTGFCHMLWKFGHSGLGLEALGWLMNVWRWCLSSCLVMQEQYFVSLWLESHTRTHTHKHTCAHTQTHARTRAHTHMCAHALAHKHVRAHAHTLTHARTHTYTHACAHTHTCTRACASNQTAFCFRMLISWKQNHE